MMGAVIKSYYAEKENIDPKRIFSVAIMPCTAKKFEADRPEMGQNAQPDIDAVLTTRELAKLLRKFGVVLDKVEPEEADNPLGTRSTAGKIFGATGGVMEAAVRTAHYLLTGKEMENLVISEVRELKGVKEASVTIDNLKVGIAVASGLGNARKLLDQIKAGRSDLHFIEIMTCPGGCIAGGGQPFGIGKKNIRARMKKLYDIDRQETIRTSHNNPMIKQLYDDFLEKPLGKKSHKLLHTHYHERSESR